jgi:hypothetical protein
MPQTFTVGSRSRFVSLVACLFLLIGLAGMAAGLIELATQRAWAAALGLAADASDLPVAARWIARELPLVIASGVALSGALAVCALGLLQRLEWARRAFLGLLVLVVVVTLAGGWLQQEFVQLLVDSTHRHAAMPAAAVGVFDGLVTAARWMAAGATAAAILVIAGIARRLASAGVRQEFA